MNAVRIKSYAKLNLTLKITGKENGFHSLDSLVCSVDLYDLIIASRRTDEQIKVEMHGYGSEFIPRESNNAVMAAESYVRKFSTYGANIKIYKNIPVGAGMGGSSADAAGVLNAMNKLYGAADKEDLKAIADELGSDTGYMLTGGFARLSGRGEKVQFLESPLKLNFLMLLPDKGVSTAQCYNLYDDMPLSRHNGADAVHALLNGNTEALAGSMFNDLFLPACKLNGDVNAAFRELEGFSPLGVNMTGSGSGVFAIFGDSQFCDWAQSRYNGRFRCLKVKSVNPNIK